MAVQHLEPRSFNIPPLDSSVHWSEPAALSFTMGTNNPSDEQLDLVTERECPPSKPSAAARHLAAVAPTAPELDPSPRTTCPFVSTGIISIASSLYPYVALDANSYFDEAGFDDEMSAQLQAKLTEYIQSADEVVPSPEEHPQPRRMARYLLENVDYDEVRHSLSPPPP